MSLYGQVKRVPTNVFLFDRVYPNRKTMEDAAKTDGVYIGRYVLIEYGTRYKLFGSAEPRENETNYYNLDDPTQVPTGESQGSDNNESQESSNNTNNNNNNSQDSSEVIVDLHGDRIEETLKYKTNRETDLTNYHAVYDSTVWQKIYAGTLGEKYVMIAELNALAPQIASKITNPLEYSVGNVSSEVEPVYYIVKDSTTNRPIAAVPITNLTENMVEPSFDMLQSNELAYTLNMPATVKFSVDETLNYNEDGFDYVYSLPTNDEEQNFICWSPVIDFNENEITVNADETATYHNNSENERDLLASEKRLYFNVPAIGNLMKHLYDLIYGLPVSDDENPNPANVRGYFLDAYNHAGKVVTEDNQEVDRTIENDAKLGERIWLNLVPDIGSLLANNSEGLAGILSHLINSKDPLTGQIRYYLLTSWNEYFDPDRNSPFIDNKPEIIGNSYIKSNGMIGFSPCDYVIDYNSWSIITPIKNMFGVVKKISATTAGVTFTELTLDRFRYNQNNATISLLDNIITISGNNLASYSKDDNDTGHKYLALDIYTGLDSIIGLKLDDYAFTSQDENMFSQPVDGSVSGYFNLEYGHIVYWLKLDEIENLADGLTITLKFADFVDKQLTFKFLNNNN